MKQYRIDIEDDVRDVVLVVEADGAKTTIRGSPDSMRLLRDELTRAIVCAEVWSSAALDTAARKGGG